MNEPPQTLLRFARFFGGDPSKRMSLVSGWLLTVIGVAQVAIALLLYVDLAVGLPLWLLAIIAFGSLLVAQGASGLLMESRGGPARWLFVLHALLCVLLIVLACTQLYLWAGLTGAGICFLVLVLLLVREWRMPRSEAND